MQWRDKLYAAPYNRSLENTNMRRISRVNDLRRCSVQCYLEQLVYASTLPLPALSKLTIDTDNRLSRRLHATRHSPRTLHRPRRLCAHLSRRRTTVAFLQQEPRGLATSAQLDSAIQHRSGRAEGGMIFRNTHRMAQTEFTWFKGYSSSQWESD
jgi:hypothetical protein